MKTIKILDCTLRDGGSLNNWIFGTDKIADIYQKLNDAQIDVVETGFIDNHAKENKESCLNSSNIFFDNLSSNITKKHCKAVAMIDLSKYDISKFNLTKANNLNGIRIMFKKEQLSDAISFAKKLKSLNYEVSLNPVSITTYSETDIKKLIEQANILNPNVLYIVDTYGLLNTNETLRLYNTFNALLNPQILIGYHCHNNLQLSFANSIAITEQNDNRNIIIDSSLYGMGKRAGNLPTELIADYLNNKYNKKYDIDILTEIIEKIIMPLHKYFEWGYSITHYLAAINKCHSDYVSYLKNSKGYSYKKINQILQRIEFSKRLTFDKNYINKLIQGETDCEQ